MGAIIDLSLMIETDMPTCGTAWHQSVKVSKMGTIETVGRNTSKIILGSHSGTHIDAPLHFIEGGNSIESLDLSILCGKVTIIDFSDFDKVSISAEDFYGKTLSKRIILRFDWFEKWKQKEYYENFPYLEKSAAKYLIDNGVKLIAMDTPSPDPGTAIGVLDDSPVHKLLLQEGVIIIEYLSNTNQIKMDKQYELVALPLKVLGSDGCPARVIVREIN